MINYINKPAVKYQWDVICATGNAWSVALALNQNNKSF